MREIGAAYNTGLASCGVTCKYGDLSFYSSVVLVDIFVLLNQHFLLAKKD